MSFLLGTDGLASNGKNIAPHEIKISVLLIIFVWVSSNKYERHIFSLFFEYFSH